MPSSRIGAVAAFLVAAAMLFWHLGGPALMQPDEGRNAEVAREMSASGDWLVPTLEGQPYLDKPAFFFAAGALAMRALGVSELAARLPSALSAAALLGLLFAFLRRRYDGSSAACAVVVLATSPMVFFHARIVIFDMMLALFMTAAVLASFEAEEREGGPRVALHLSGAAAAGLATLVKGPVGFVVPGLVVAAFFLADGRPAALRRTFGPASLAVFLAVVLPWFAALVRAHPDFLRYGLVEETLHRFTRPAFERGGPPWYYVPILAGGLLTWFAALPGAAIGAWRRRRLLSRTDRLLVVWTLTVFVFFSLSRTKHAGYVLPGIVPLGALLGRVFALAVREPAGAAARTAARAAGVLGALALALGALLAWEMRHPGTLAALGKLEPDDAHWLGGAAAALLAGLGATAALGAFAFARRAPRAALAAFAVLPVALVTAGYPGIAAYAEGRSARPLAAALAGLPRGADVAFVESYAAGLSFYLGRTVTLISDDGAPLRSNYVVRSLRLAGAHPPGIVPVAEREAWLASRPGPVCLLARGGGRSFLEEAARARGSEAALLAPGWWGAVLPGPAGP